MESVSEPELITPEELATKLRLTVSTIYNKLGRLDRAVGVYRLGPRCTRIDWPLFLSKLRSGEIAFGRPR